MPGMQEDAVARMDAALKAAQRGGLGRLRIRRNAAGANRPLLAI
jgi:hypothetical protein